MTIWILIAIIGFGTFLLRLSFLTKSNPTYPAGVARALRFVPVTVLAALFAPKVFVIDGQINLFENLFILPTLVAGVVAWSTKHLGLTIGVGLAVFWTLTWALA